MIILKICHQLKKFKVPYAIVGGHAVALHGAVRGTIDVDIIIKWALKNLRNTQNALLEIGLVSRLPISAEDIFQFKDEYIKNKNLIAWNFINHDNPSEQVDVILTFDLSGKKIKKIEVENQTINILNLKDLIKMKRAAKRPQDLADVAALEKIHKRNYEKK